MSEKVLTVNKKAMELALGGAVIAALVNLTYLAEEAVVVNSTDKVLSTFIGASLLLSAIVLIIGILEDRKKYFPWAVVFGYMSLLLTSGMAFIMALQMPSFTVTTGAYAVPLPYVAVDFMTSREYYVQHKDFASLGGFLIPMVCGLWILLR